ncbi:MAG: CHAT domain-containing protein, partial [bacterium]
RVNGEMARLRLVATGHGDAATLAQRAELLESQTHKNLSSYVHYLRAAATLMTDRARGEAALRGVIADANAAPGEPNAPYARASAYATLIERAAAAGDADGVLTLLAHRLGVATPGHCLVGVAQWNRAAVAVRGADGTAAVQLREVPEESILLPPTELIPDALQARLAGCRRVEVMASGPYFGRAGLLPPSMAWAYRSSSRAAAGAPPSGVELIVTDVRPPDEMSLPRLRSFRGSSSAVVLDREHATPSATLDRMRTAGLIVIVAHGITDAREPSAASLILSPDREGDYLLTASKVSTARLDGAPIVILAGCDAGRVSVSAEPWSLATSFLAAGARAVMAPTERIPDDEAGKAFESLVQRIRDGADPVEALQKERSDRGADAAWLSSVIIFE